MHMQIFYLPHDRKVSKVNVFSINNQQYECPVDLRGKTIQVRYDRTRHDRFIVYFKGQRMGQASGLNLSFNAHRRREQAHD